jgi:hypothetical protein
MCNLLLAGKMLHARDDARARLLAKAGWMEEKAPLVTVFSSQHMGQNASALKPVEEQHASEIDSQKLADSLISTTPSSLSFIRSRADFAHIKSRLSKWELRSLYAAFNELKTTFSDDFECIELKKFLVSSKHACVGYAVQFQNPLDLTFFIPYRTY